jgi:sterol desaturase/sphingolipid hydroxylase (fatty acid hydroxylase superfamily)
MLPRTIAAWSIYPLSWLVLVVVYAATWHGLGYQAAWASFVVLLLLLYVCLERVLPYEARWSMTWDSFKADLKYIVINIGTLIAINATLSWLSISLAENRVGPAHGWPLWVQLIVCLLVFEALNYGIHRAEHEAPGRLGLFLWRVHAAHHLPERVYVVMHAVFHPINALFVQVVAVTLPIWIAGYDQRVVTLFLMINSLHGLISHFNVDVRMGWVNYVFVGTELHRYHHSAEPAEGKNYGAVLSVFDQLFGTFVYKPGQAPATLGVADAALPNQNDYLGVLALPFKKGPLIAKSQTRN